MKTNELITHVTNLLTSLDYLNNLPEADEYPVSLAISARDRARDYLTLARQLHQEMELVLAELNRYDMAEDASEISSDYHEMRVSARDVLMKAQDEVELAKAYMLQYEAGNGE